MALLRIQMLGPIRVWRDGHQLDLGPTAQRAVLGLLTLARGQPLARAEIMNGIWYDREPPPTATNVIQTHVKHLRRLLEPDRRPHAPSAVLRQVGDGYALHLPAAAVDLVRFRELVAAASGAQRRGHLEEAADALEEALGLWHGAPLADIPTLASHPKVVALAAERQVALGRYGDTMIAIGRAAEGLPALEEAATAEPMDEAGLARLIRAYHAAGRRDQAFATYHDVRRRLADELAVAPGPELSAAHSTLLHDEPQPGTRGAVAVSGGNTATTDGGHARNGGATGNGGGPGDGGPARGGERCTPADGAAPGSAAPTANPRSAEPEAGSATGPGPAAGPVPAQLPADTIGFVGRAGELARLDGLLSEALERGSRAVVVCAVSGTAGVGKTALAVHWAHQVTRHFPDGQLYVNLRGFGPTGAAMDPTEAIRWFLDALDVPADRIPADLDAQAALYRSRLAGRRVLIVVDNARDAAQVRPLLPGTPGCLVLVTSRNQMSSLVATGGAHPLPLDLLTADDARALFTRRVGVDRTSGEPAAVTEILDRCAGLPLALAVIAARAAVSHTLPLSALAQRLRRDHERLDALTTGDPSTDLRAVLSASYRALRPPTARLFRLLGLHPGPDISAPAAASLAARPLGEVREMLAGMAGANLVVEHLPGRYTFHDLLRAYAADTATRTDRRTPAARLHAAAHRPLPALSARCRPAALPGPGRGHRTAAADRDHPGAVRGPPAGADLVHRRTRRPALRRRSRRRRVRLARLAARLRHVDLSRPAGPLGRTGQRAVRRGGRRPPGRQALRPGQRPPLPRPGVHPAQPAGRRARPAPVRPGPVPAGGRRQRPGPHPHQSLPDVGPVGPLHRGVARGPARAGGLPGRRRPRPARPAR